MNIMRMLSSICDEPGKKGKRKPTNCPEKKYMRKKEKPRVVNKHSENGNKLNVEGGHV